MAITHRTLTLEEFLRLPEEKPALEFEEGAVNQKVSPKGKHGRAQLRLASIIDEYVYARRQGATFTELRVTFAGRSYVPDISVVRWDRLPVDPDGEVGNEFPIPPDVAVEIVSPEQRVAAQARRCRWYVDNGVQVALLFNPETHLVQVFRPGAEPVTLSEADTLDLEPAVPGFRLPVRDLLAVLKLR